MLKRAGVIIKFVFESKMLELWDEAWSREKTNRKLHTICPKSTKKALNPYKCLSKVAGALILQMKIENIGLKKFL